MKDKIKKNGHKGLYYKTRRFFIGSIIVTSLFAAIALPTYIYNKYNNEQQSHAKDNNETEQENNLDNLESFEQE